jgi:hypothetical protein
MQSVVLLLWGCFVACDCAVGGGGWCYLCGAMDRLKRARGCVFYSSRDWKLVGDSALQIQRVLHVHFRNMRYRNSGTTSHTHLSLYLEQLFRHYPRTLEATAFICCHCVNACCEGGELKQPAAAP